MSSFIMFGLNFKENAKPKSEKSPKWFIDSEDGKFSGIAWEAIDERDGRKGMSIKIFKNHPNPDVETVQVADQKPFVPNPMDATYAKATAEGPTGETPF